MLWVLIWVIILCYCVGMMKCWGCGIIRLGMLLLVIGSFSVFGWLF